LDDMARRGIEFIHCYCVDNCLVRVADPVFIGYCVERDAQCGAKVVPKTSPDEAVGVICLRNGRYSVVEYSEISKEMSHQTKADGALVYNAGNICNHFYTLSFLQQVCSPSAMLEHHVALKKIPCVDMTTGQLVKPQKPNGMKLELFVFDVFPLTRQFATLEVERSEEFSPLKNAPGSGADCPETSRLHLLKQQIRFVERAGGKVNLVLVNETEQNAQFEISSLVSYAGEGLEAVHGRTFNTPCLVGAAGDLLRCSVAN